MGRWGQEEKKTTGLVGFGIWLGIFLLVGMIFYTNMDGLEHRRKLEIEMQNIVRTGVGEPVEKLVVKIVEAAEEMGADLAAEQVDLKMWPDDYGNWEADCRIDYHLEVNIWVAKFET